MPRYTYRYHEEDYGVIAFEAPNLEKAQELFESVRCNEIEHADLPNYSRRTKGGEYDFTDLQEVKEPKILIEALEIAKNNFDYDGEYGKANAVRKYINELGLKTGENK